MSGERRKHRFWKRRSWGKIRSKVRQRFSKSNFEVEPGFLRANDTWQMMSHWDSSRMREKMQLHPKRYRRVVWLIETVIVYGKGDTSKLEKIFGLFAPRCLGCRKKMHSYEWYFPIMPDGIIGPYCRECGNEIIDEKEREKHEGEKTNLYL
jgi:hypothetical protein